MLMVILFLVASIWMLADSGPRNIKVVSMAACYVAGVFLFITYMETSDSLVDGEVVGHAVGGARLPLCSMTVICLVWFLRLLSSTGSRATSDGVGIRPRDSDEDGAVV